MLTRVQNISILKIASKNRHKWTLFATTPNVLQITLVPLSNASKTPRKDKDSSGMN